jgi:hypothetical protein
MADFCKECSIELFGYDAKELASLCEVDEYVHVMCEGCGPIMVNSLGIRFSTKLSQQEFGEYIAGKELEFKVRSFKTDPIVLKQNDENTST